VHNFTNLLLKLIEMGANACLEAAPIEVIQIHLPGRVAEITDPLLALLLAMTLRLLDRSERLRSNSPSKGHTCDVELP
jgi:hypothetical protein